MDIFVLNSNFERIALMDEYESCIWNIKYFDVGDFELYISASCENIKLLQRGHYLVRDKDIVAGCMYNVMIIEKIETQTDIENGDHLIVTGRELKSIVGRRIIWSQTNINGKVEVAMRKLLTDHIIAPADSARKIDNVILGELMGYPETMKQQVTGDNLLEYMTKVLTTYGIGWKCCLNENRQMVFSFYKGVDRSLSQDDNPHIVFSAENENILNSDHMVDYSAYKNVALIAGEGEGLARKTASIGTATGLDRYELYVDQRDASTNEGEITEDEYTEMLKQSGNEALGEHKMVETFEGEIEPHAMYVYGEDYQLGDIVTVTNLYDVTSNPRIIGVIESYSDEGESIIPTFSTWE